MPEMPELTNECFFIAPIGESGSDTRRRSDGVLKYIVGRAADEVGLTAVRADQLAEPGQINLQVVDHVLRAKAAVADMTGLNPNVFYEIAIRHTARLPLVLIAEKDCQLPFDIANMRTIFFDHTDLESADSCREAIVAALKPALDGGVVDSPIGTSIDLSSMSGGNAMERGIADILSTLEDLAKEQREVRTEVEGVRRLQHRTVHPAALSDAMHRLERLVRISEGIDDPELAEAIDELRRPLMYMAPIQCIASTCVIDERCTAMGRRASGKSSAAPHCPQQGSGSSGRQ
jgi:hypothetical protein